MVHYNTGKYIYPAVGLLTNIFIVDEVKRLIGLFDEVLGKQ
jgi:hypothetical protein